jgi:hypothetical protein
LTDAVVRAWPTPTASRYGTRNNGDPGDGRGEYLAVRLGGVLNPAWIEALMGFPPGWSELGPQDVAKILGPANRRARSNAATAGQATGSERPARKRKPKTC